MMQEFRKAGAEAGVRTVVMSGYGVRRVSGGVAQWRDEEAREESGEGRMNERMKNGVRCRADGYWSWRRLCDPARAVCGTKRRCFCFTAAGPGPWRGCGRRMIKG